MSTRGALIYVIDGVDVIMYSRSDSYPGGLGEKVVKLVQSFVGYSPIEVAAVSTTEEGDRRITEFVDEFRRKKKTYLATTAERFKLDDVLSLSALKSYDQVIPITSEAWLADSLFCEWGYRLDFNQKELEVYKGFVRDKKDLRGRYSAIEPMNPGNGFGRYWPISLVASASFYEPDLLDNLIAQIRQEE